MTSEAELHSTVLELIKEQQFSAAQIVIADYIDTYNTPYANYLMGYLHISAKYKPTDFESNDETAIKYFSIAADCDKPIEQAFLELARLKPPLNTKLRILKRGISFFPKSKILHEMQLSLTKDKNIIEPVINNIIEKNIYSKNIYFWLYSFYKYHDDYTNAENYINLITAANPEEERALKVEKAFLCYEKSELSRAIKSFNNLIEEDIRGELNYSAHIGKALCHISNKELDRLEILLLELPIEFDEMFVGSSYPILFAYDNYLDQLLKSGIKTTSSISKYKQTYAKLRGIRGLRVIQNDNVTKKSIDDLIFAAKHSSNNVKYNSYIVYAFLIKNEIEKAVSREIENYINNYSYKNDFDFYLINDLEGDLIDDITGLILLKIDDLPDYRKSKLEEFIAGLIKLFHGKGKHDNIVKICKMFDEDFLFEQDIAFQYAYACEASGKTIEAKKTYKKIKVTNNSSAVLNNLAIIYEEEDLPAALELIRESIALEPTSELAQNNKKRIEAKLLKSKNEEYILIKEKLNFSNFSDHGFTDELLKKLEQICTNNALKIILERDIREAVFTLITKCYKSTIIICGSIIESLLLDKVTSIGITKAKPSETSKKEKKIIEMNISGLLFVAKENELIKPNLYHFAHALRHYRNIVHPAIELSKGTYQTVTEEDAYLAWNIVKKIIKEL